ncbi:MAG: ROK family protein [Clostridia bacterium]
MKYKIGIDLGGTNIAIGICDKDFNIVAKGSIKTVLEYSAEEIVGAMAGEIANVLKMANIDIKECESIGIGCPGYCDSEKCELVCASNLHLNDTNFREQFSKYFDLPIYLSNDANCAALGEVLCGAAKGYDSAVMITIGTGIGSGIIIDKKILAGYKSAGAEFGHSVLILGGELCSCGRRGCIEKYASASALVNQTKRAAFENPASLLNFVSENDTNNINGKTAFVAKSMGDIVATRVVEQYIEYLGAAITDAINIFRPEIIILGGGVSKEGDNLVRPLQDYVDKYSYGVGFCPMPKIVVATLGNDAGIVGAAFL